MSMGYGELEANNNNSQNVTKVARKSISLKLKREPNDEPNNEAGAKEAKCQAESLTWNYKVKLTGEKKSNKVNLLNFCEKCKRPILVHGRLIPCKHFLCLNCAQKGTRNCFKCDTPIKGIQPVPKIYVCAHEGTRHSLTGCRKSYLNFLGLDQHQKLRHSDEASTLDPNVDSDGELSVNKQPATSTAQPAPAQQPAPALQPPAQQVQQQGTAAPQPQQFTMQPLQAGTLVSMASVMTQPPPQIRPMMFPTMQSAQQQQSVAQMTNSTRLTFAHPTPRPTAVLLFPRPQLTVTSMAPLLVPPRGMGAPQMMTLPGMLPQPAGMQMMPLPQQYAGIPPPQAMAQHLVTQPTPMPAPMQLPVPPALPMPEQIQQHREQSLPTHQMRDTPPLMRDFTPPLRDPPSMRDGPPGMRDGPPGMRDGPPGMRDGPPGMRDGPPGIRDGPPGMRDGPPMRDAPPMRDGDHMRDVPRQLRDGRHYSPSNEPAPPPPPPRNLRSRSSDNRNNQRLLPERRMSDQREQRQNQREFRYNSREEGFPPRDPRVESGVPRDPRKARDIPPPPPPKNGTVR